MQASHTPGLLSAPCFTMACELAYARVIRLHLTHSCLWRLPLAHANLALSPRPLFQCCLIPILAEQMCSACEVSCCDASPPPRRHRASLNLHCCYAPTLPRLSLRLQVSVWMLKQPEMQGKVSAGISQKTASSRWACSCLVEGSPCRRRRSRVQCYSHHAALRPCLRLHGCPGCALPFLQPPGSVCAGLGYLGQLQRGEIREPQGR